MIKLNKKQLIKQAVQGQIIHAYDNYANDNDKGYSRYKPFCESITYDVKIGDPIDGLVGDHIEPAVTINNANKDEQAALVKLACIGNEAIVVTGKAEGSKGRVTGKHGGGWNVIIDFDDETIEKLNYDDQILVKSIGQGLELVDYPEIVALSIDPNLFEKIPIGEIDNKLIFPVVTVVPAFLCGSGVGGTLPQAGDLDIMTSDEEIAKKYNIDKLKFGDFVFLEDSDNRFSHSRRKGAVTIGVVIHGDSYIGGHGPGICPVLTCPSNLIVPKIDNESNLVKYFEMLK